MFFHRQVTCLFRPLAQLRGRHRRTRRIESPLEILYVKPEAEVLLAKVGSQELSKQTPEHRFVQDMLQSCRMAIYGMDVLVDTF